MKAWAAEWFQRFWDKHGERNFYLACTTFYGTCFVVIGAVFKEEFGDKSDMLIGAGLALLIGAAQLCNNKARSPEEKTNEKIE